MNRKSMQKAMIVAVAVAVTYSGLAIGEAEARAPGTSQLVNFVTVTVPNGHLPDDTDEATVYVGIDECDSLINNDPDVEVQFESEQVAIGENTLFGGVFYYQRERGATRVNCWDDGDINDECDGEIGGDDIDREGAMVDIAIPFQELTGLTDSGVCEAGELDQNYYVQLRIRENLETEAFRRRPEGRVVLDLIRPEAPELSDALATENSIFVEFEASESDDVRRHYIVHSSEPFEEGALLDDIETTRSPRSFTGEESGRVDATLVPGNTIFVGVLAGDHARNFSAVSNSMELTVTETQNFWDYYVDAGGSEEGGYGCQSTSSGGPTNPVWWVVAIMMTAMWWRARQVGQDSKNELRVCAAKDGRR